MSIPVPPSSSRILWSHVLVGALLMLATLPGRTQGLGLITEPLLADLKVDRVSYATINLWATLLGAAACFPAGWLLDRLGLRIVSAGLVLGLGAVVWGMSLHTGGALAGFFLWALLTRALGQSALSVASITAVGKTSQGPRGGLAMGLFSVVLSILFIVAFLVVGAVVRDHGWRAGWQGIAGFLVLCVAPLALIFLKGRESAASDQKETSQPLEGTSLWEALRTPAFWIFAVATALFGLVSSGLGLFNEAVLKEAGFGHETFTRFLAALTLFALIGQMLCGWLSLRQSLPGLLGISLGLYGAGLALLPAVRGFPLLWTAAAILGVAAGFITVIFFAVWGAAYGKRELGRIQGAAQALTVLASAVGPLLFATVHQRTGSYAPLLYALAPVVLVLGVVAWRTKLPTPASDVKSDPA